MTGQKALQLSLMCFSYFLAEMSYLPFPPVALETKVKIRERVESTLQPFKLPFNCGYSVLLNILKTTTLKSPPLMPGLVCWMSNQIVWCVLGWKLGCSSLSIWWVTWEERKRAMLVVQWEFCATEGPQGGVGSAKGFIEQEMIVFISLLSWAE